MNKAPIRYMRQRANITNINTPYGKADIFAVNLRTIRVQTEIGKVCFRMEKSLALALNRNLKFKA